MVRTRIAPSPTGENLHIGNVYTALINFAVAHKNNGKFIVRIEDTDRMRLIPGAEERILESLKWIGLNYDEGPDIGGPFAPYRQSERKEIYKKYTEKLVNKRKAYYCFCDSKRLEEMRKLQQEKKERIRYDGFCKRYSYDIAKEKTKKQNYVVRLNVPQEGRTEFNDVIHGKISFENNQLDDQVLLKSDGFPTYHLGVVVDDHLMEITHIIRAEEWISSTPKHILIYKALGWNLPVFAHTPILRNPDKSKFSKRKNPVWISWYREEGFLPEAILNYLALMGWSHPEQKEIFSLEEFIHVFNLKDVKPVGPIFDVEKLKWMNGEYIRGVHRDILIQKLKKFYKNDEDVITLLNKEYALSIVLLAQSRMKTLKEFKKLVIPLRIKLLPEEIIVVNSLAETLKKIDHWNKKSILEAMKLVLKTSGVNGKILYKVITGRETGLPLPDVLSLLGKEQTLKRLGNSLST